MSKLSCIFELGSSFSYRHILNEYVELLNWVEQSACAGLGHYRQNVLAPNNSVVFSFFLLSFFFSNLVMGSYYKQILGFHPQIFSGTMHCCIFKGWHRVLNFAYDFWEVREDVWRHVCRKWGEEWPLKPWTDWVRGSQLWHADISYFPSLYLYSFAISNFNSN